MSKNSIIFLLGILVAIVPFLGFPVTIRSYTLLVLGLCIAGISFWRERGESLKQYLHIPDTHTKGLFDEAGHEERN